MTSQLPSSFKNILTLLLTKYKAQESLTQDSVLQNEVVVREYKEGIKNVYFEDMQVLW